MRSPAHTFFWHILSIVSAGIILLGFVLTLARLEDQSKNIVEQTDINQRYLRCILLIPREEFATDESRVEAIDKCAIESRLPNGQPTTPQPTLEDKEEFENSNVQDRAVVPISETPNQEPPKDQSKQSSSEPVEEIPDNDGIIVHLPLLPAIHIGSPL